MKEKFMRFMQGRYGVDQLSKALIVIGLISILLASFFRGSLVGTFFYYVGWFLIISGRESSIIFINARDAVRRSGFQEAKERLRSVVRSVAQSSLKRAEKV